jgi:hypothetical protein
LNEDFLAIVKELNLPAGRFEGFTLHSLRHSFETIAVNAGIPQRVVDTWLGHRSDQSMAAPLLQAVRPRLPEIHGTGPVRDRHTGGRRRRLGGRSLNALLNRMVLLLALLAICWPVVAPQLTSKSAVTAPDDEDSEAGDACRDKSWTNGAPENNVGSQVLVGKALASRVSLEAEGMGFEPTTPFGAPDFESSNDLRLASRYPSIMRFSRGFLTCCDP